MGAKRPCDCQSMPLRRSTVSVKKTCRGHVFRKQRRVPKHTLVVRILYSEPSEAVLNGSPETKVGRQRQFTNGYKRFVPRFYVFCAFAPVPDFLFRLHSIPPHVTIQRRRNAAMKKPSVSWRWGQSCTRPFSERISPGRQKEYVEQIRLKKIAKSLNKNFKALVFTQGGPSDIAYHNCQEDQLKVY